MTQLLEKAIAELRSLPEAEHEWAADNIRMIIRERERASEYRLTPEQVAEVEQTIADLDSGRARLLTVDETEAMWRRLGA